jgi:hypothetical protein
MVGHSEQSDHIEYLVPESAQDKFPLVLLAQLVPAEKQREPHAVHVGKIGAIEDYSGFFLLAQRFHRSAQALDCGSVDGAGNGKDSHILCIGDLDIKLLCRHALPLLWFQ